MNSYFELGLSDFKFSLYGYEEKEYNQVCSLGVQSIEKFLKAIIEVKSIGSDASLLKTHNLKILIKEVNSVVQDFMPDVSGIYQISSYYFDVRYPGDNFYEPDKQDAILVTETAYEVYQKVCKVLNKEMINIDVSFIY